MRHAETAHPRDITQRIAALIAIRRRVGHFTDPHTIEHDPDYAPEHNLDCIICVMAPNVDPFGSSVRLLAEQLQIKPGIDDTSALHARE